jgi:RNA polymerase sigma factor (sigma-70 family)
MPTAAGRPDGILGMLHQLTPSGDLSARPDADLLDRFIGAGDPAAFEALIRRHGPMVLGVCRRLLRNPADAEDAFQATFLVLVRKAASVAPRSLVGHWLYGVACKTAQKARAMREKRRQVEAKASRMDAPQPTRAGAAEFLDEELAGLPEKYRVPVVLCELQGQTLRQVADLLGCPQGTVASRLARGRDLLARRLRQRGVLGAALTTLFAQTATAVPPALAASTARAAALFAAGNSAAGRVALLVEGVLKMMLLNKLRGAATLLVLAALACAAGTMPLLARPVEPAAEQPRPTAVTKPGSPAPPTLSGTDELKALAKRWQDRSEKYFALMKGENDYRKQIEAARRLLPSHDPRAVEAFFDLEKRHRGKEVGLFALNFVMMRACQHGDPDIPLTRGRERALDILHRHYLRHQNLDLLLGWLRGGPLVFAADDLLKAAAQKSPHDYVRAAALYYRADQLKLKADCKTIWTAKYPRKEPPSPYERALEEQTRRTLQRLKTFDVKEARKEAARLAKEVLAKYPKVVAPLRLAEPETPYMPKRMEPVKPSPEILAWRAKSGYKPPRMPTYAERAEALLFDLAHLALDQPAPPMEGNDAHGKRFRLADAKGKVVVLMFSANWCGPCKARYPALRALQKKFKGKPVEIVTVMADQERATVLSALDKGDITWRAVWDGAQGPIMTKWNVQGLPTLYVIDRQGIIRGREVADDKLDDLVAELLEGKAPRSGLPAEAERVDDPGR